MTIDNTQVHCYVYKEHAVLETDDKMLGACVLGPHGEIMDSIGLADYLKKEFTVSLRDALDKEFDRLKRLKVI